MGASDNGIRVLGVSEAHFMDVSSGSALFVKVALVTQLSLASEIMRSPSLLSLRILVVVALLSK